MLLAANVMGISYKTAVNTAVSNYDLSDNASLKTSYNCSSFNFSKNNYNCCMQQGFYTPHKQVLNLGTKHTSKNFCNIKLYPGGMPFGLKLYTDGVVIVGLSDFESGNKKVSPAKNAGLMTKDIIKCINDKPVNTTEEVSSAFENSGGKSLSVTINRNGKNITVELTPMYSQSDNMYKTGMWIRDSAAGIGTVTFICPETNMFAGLGHGICDVDTGELLPLRRGSVADVTINGVNKGKIGAPGELIGYFSPGKSGSLIGNTPYGVYGALSNSKADPDTEPLSITPKDEVTTGKVKVICTVNNKKDSYDAEIIKISARDSDQKNFVIKITDKRLLEATGGIVQGM